MVGRVLYTISGLISLCMAVLCSTDANDADMQRAVLPLALVGLGLLVGAFGCGAAEGGRQTAAAMTRLAEVTQWKVTEEAQRGAAGPGVAPVPPFAPVPQPGAPFAPVPPLGQQQPGMGYPGQPYSGI